MKKLALIISILMFSTFLFCSCNKVDNLEENSNNTSQNISSQNIEENTDNIDGEITNVNNSVSSLDEISYNDVLKTEPAPASDFLYNELENGTIEIYKYQGNNEIVNVPILIDGKKVTTILRTTFKSCDGVRAILLPVTIASLDGTFERMPNLEIVVCPGVKKIISNPFDKSEKVTVYCEKGSYMHSYASARKINFELIDKSEQP